MTIAQLAVGDVPGQILHAAVGREHDPVRLHVRQCASGPPGNHLGAFHLRLGEVQHPEDDRLAGQSPSTDGSRPDCAVSIDTWSQGQSASSGRNEDPAGRSWMIAA